MTYQELQDELNNVVFEEAGPGATRIQQALRRVHLKLQRGEVMDPRTREILPLDWRCQEYTTPDGLTYPAGSTAGIEIDTFAQGETVITTKRVLEAWRLTAEGARVPLNPSTDYGRRRIEDAEYQVNGRMPQFTGQAPGRLLGGDYHERWYVDGSKLQLTHPPASDQGDTTVYVKVLRYLPFYTEPASTDYFSERLWDVLTDAAAKIIHRQLWEDDRAGLFDGDALESLIAAIRMERDARRGGTARVYRPPLPGWRS